MSFSPAERKPGISQPQVSVLLGEGEFSCGPFVSFQLQVTAVLVKGVVCDALQDACLAAGIILLFNTPSKVLLAISEACDIPLAVYVMECVSVR